MSDTPPYDMRLPMQSWDDLEHFMDGLAIFNLATETERASGWPPSWTHAFDVDSMVEALKQAEKPHLADIEAAVSLISISGEVSLEGFERETIRLLNTRGSAVAWFVSQFLVKDSTIIPLPTAPMGDVVRWFLCDWWYRHGYTSWCDTWISEQWTNQSSK